MARTRRDLTAFSLSFLDIMSCGFGAVVLLFLIIKHNVDTNVPAPITNPDLTSEVDMLEYEILEGQKGLAELRNTISDLEQRVVIAQGLARRASDEITDTSGQLEEIQASGLDSITEKLKNDIKKLETDRDRLMAETDNTGQDTRSFTGEGNREYLTGLKLGGRNILVLLDASASMLDDTIVNIIRRRNMSDEVKKSSAKWRRMIETIDWLSAKFPTTSKYQIYTFNTEVTPVIDGTLGKWLSVSDSEQLEESINGLDDVIPGGGTSLEKAFIAITRLRPMPDNIYLITDGLPTQGQNPPRSTTISGRDRLGLFEDAMKKVPNGIPFNVILAPMEGDPMAASAFWQLAQLTRGSYMSPTEDWP
jgi:hypothetical protein